MTVQSHVNSYELTPTEWTAVCLIYGSCSVTWIFMVTNNELEPFRIIEMTSLYLQFSLLIDT